MAIIKNRYTYDQAAMKPMWNGQWGRAIDQTFQREVVLYTFHEAEAVVHQEALRWLSKASQMSSDHFMHILDAGSQDGMLFAVLQAITGGPLIDQLAAQEISGRNALACVYELTKAIRESRVLRLPECAVDVENLWMEDNGRLRVINYWSEGKIGRRGVPGLALLLYQLSAKTDIPTSSTDAYAFEIKRMFADMPDETRDRTVAWACRGYEGKSSLAEFQQEMEVLLGIRAASGTAPQQRKLTAYHAPVVTGPSGLKSFQLRKNHLLIAASCLSIIVLMVWLSTRANPSQMSTARPQPTPSPVHTAAQPSNDPPKPTASAPASATPDPTTAPTAAPTEAMAAPADEVQPKAGVVPDLVAHTKEEAVKMAMASGLRYQFFLESNEAANGMVFKQDLTPGTAVNHGDRITFWVSKGK
ncbi:PASTA domain-containing protein [Paenibacillus aestuarii]|uniref:PASTA domain-containing protein n=1 Tax=Paenibacillus aestuarii TaxID=516965 RepID=A0ABW0K7J2_9BACL|nr:PASTA domain-containing protein [Paenibacillus aestuarii]